MRPHQSLRLRVPHRPSQRERAPIWRQFAAGTIDGVLELCCRIAWRVLANWATAEESAPKMTDRVRTALRQVFAPQRPHDESAPRCTPEDAEKVVDRLPRSFFEAVGRGHAMSAESVVRRSAWELIFLAGPLILTDGQTPGRVILGVQVVSLDGRPITARQTLVRGFGYTAVFVVLDRLPLPPAIRGAVRLALRPSVRFLDHDRRSLDDLLAGTRVVRTT